MVEITSEEQNKVKRMKRTEDSIRHFWDNIKHPLFELQGSQKKKGRRQWQPTPVFLPGESQGWQSLLGCRLCGRTQSDMTETTQQQAPMRASQVAQTIKNPPAVQESQEIQIRSLGLEDPWRKAQATHASILAWRIPRTEEPGWATVYRVTKSQIQLK